MDTTDRRICTDKKTCMAKKETTPRATRAWKVSKDNRARWRTCTAKRICTGKRITIK